MKVPNFKENKGITLAALVITIIVLLIIATITVTTLSGNNGIVQHTVTAKEESEIKSELKVVDLASNQAKNKNKYGDVTGEELVKALKNNAGEDQTEVEYYEKGSLYFVTFKKSNRVYEVTTAGYAKYVGKPEDAVVLFGKPKSSIAPKTSVEVNVIIKTLQENKIDKLEYVWNKSEDKQPSKEEFSNNTPKVLENVENEKTEKQTIVSLPEGTPEGEYYLWVKVTNNGEETIEHLGPYIIGEVSCQLAVDPNGGTWDGSSEVKVIKQSVGNKIDLKTPNPPANYEITFDADGGNVSKDKVTSVVSFNRWELKGVGTLEKNTYTFGKGKATATAQYSNEKITLPTATKDGYQIDGWYDKDGNKAGDPNDEYTPTGSENLTAHWTPNSYVLAFDYKTNGGTRGPDETQQIVYGKEVILSTYQAERGNGYVFIGWNRNANDKTALDKIIMGSQNEKVYALFKKDIRLTFKDKNGDKYSNPDPVTIYNNEKGTATAPAISEYTGWEPLYWTKETKADGAKAVGAKTGDNTISNITDPATYYARYKKDITIEFDLNGGTGTKPDNATGEVHVSTSDITKPKAATINMPEIESGKEPKKDGYVFNGWNTAQDGKGTHYDIDGTGSFLDSSTLYAEWTEKKATKITLNKETATITYGDTTTIIATLEPADLVNKNVNWTTSDANICNISKATSVSGEEITLTAKKVGKATITATAADGSGKTATCVVTVVAKKITVPTAKTNLVYNAANQIGVEQTTEYNVTDGTKIDAGSYTAKVVLKDKTNTMWNDETTTDKTVDWSIAKKAITVKADNKTRKYGEENPTLTATVGETGVQGEKGKITGTPTTTAEKMSKVGNYPITRGGNLALADNDTFKANNYEIDFKDGTLTITKIDNTLNVTAKTLTYNTQEQELVNQTGLQGDIYYSTDVELTKDNYLKEGTKNTIPKGTNAGNYKVYYYAPGNENYNAKSDSVDVTIAQYSLKDAIIETVGSQIFTGSAITPKPEVKVNIPSEQNKTTLVEGRDFEYSYKDNTAVGTATITITGKGNYKDSKPITFNIENKKQIKVSKEDYTGTYNGKAQTFKFDVTEPTSGYNVYYKVGTTPLNENNYTDGTTEEKPTRKDAGTTIVQWYIHTTNAQYADTNGSIEITINPKSIDVKADDKTKKYGEENPTLTATAGETGITGETAKIAGALKTTATKTSNVGPYVIGNDNVKLTDNGTFKASNYEMNFINGTLTITKADNTLKVNAKTLTYNTTAQELVTEENKQGDVYYSIGTELTSDNYNTAGRTTIPTGTNAGDYKVYYYTPGNDNYGPSKGTVDVTIEKYDLKNANMTQGALDYTGSKLTPKPEVTVNIPSEQNKTKLTAGTEFTYSYGANTNAGTNAGSVTITAKDNTNYTGSKTVNFNINKIANTLDVKARTLTYNTQAQELVTESKKHGDVYYSLETKLTKDNCDEKGSKNVIPKETNAGTYKVYYYTPGDTNYNEKDGFVDVTIEKYSLNNAEIDSVNAKIYTGSAVTPKPEVKVNIPSEQNKTKLVEGTDFDYSYSNNNGVGTATVTVTGKGNYKDSKSITFTLADKKPIKVTPSNYSGTYNGEAHTFELNITEPAGCEIYYKEGAETLTESNYTQGTTDQKPTRTDAGTTTVQWYIHSTNAEYSDINGSSTITINKAKATKPTVKAYSGTYDGASHGVTVTGGSGGTIQYSEDNNEYSATVPKYTDFTDGEKTIYVKVAGDKNHSDSDVVTSSITINKKSIDVTAEDKSRAYGAANPELTYTHSGEVSGQTAEFIGALTTSATTESAVGTYDITQGTLALTDNGTFKASNYTINYVKGTLTVTKANGSGSVTMEDWTYGETAKNPVATSSTNGTSNVTYKYKVSTAEDSTYTEAKPSNAGIYTVQAIFAATDNYNEVTTTANFTIEQKEITVTAEEKNKAYGAENPTFTYTHSGEISGEEAGFTGALGALTIETSEPGYYDIIQGDLALADNGTFIASNYKISYTKATLRVDPKVTFNANDGTETISEQTVTYNTETALTQNAFTRDGYTFNGWNTEADGSGTSYADKANITTEVNTTLYAQWTAISYTISYDYAEGTAGTNAPTSATYDEDVQISNPTKEGYTFGGWTSSSSDGLGENAKTGTEANPSTEWTGEPTKNTYFKNLTDTNNGTVKLTATWKANYKLKKVIGASNLIANGGLDNYTLVDAPSKNSNGVTHTWDKALNGVPGNTTKAYKMTSWDEYANGTGANMGVVVPEIGYHAHMRIVNGNNVLRFKTNEAYVGKTGANVSGGKSVTPGTVYANRWLGISQKLTGTNLTAGATYVVTLDAYRVSGNQKITGGIYHATTSSNSERGFNSGMYSFNPTKTGEWETFSWTFTLASNYVNTINPSFYVYGYTGGTGELYVDNVRLEKVTDTSYITKAYDSLYTTEDLNPASRSGYSFDGWYSDARYTKRLDETDQFNTNTAVFEDVNTPNTSAYIYAKWSYNSYTIKFDKNNTNASGTMSPMSVTCGTEKTLTANNFAVTTLGVTTKQIFTGWNTKADGTGTTYSDKASVTDLTTAGGTVTLYAQWINANYEVSSPVKYTLTIEDAISKANASSTIKVIQNVTDSSTANVSKTLTLNLNGKTLTKNSGGGIRVSAGTFTVKGNGKTSTLYVTNAAGILNEGSSSAIVINSALIKSAYNPILYQSNCNGTLTVNNSWIYGTGEQGAIYLNKAGNVTINSSWLYTGYGKHPTLGINGGVSTLTLKGTTRIGGGYQQQNTSDTKSALIDISGTGTTTINIIDNTILMAGQYNGNTLATGSNRTVNIEVKGEAEMYALNGSCILVKKSGSTVKVNTFGWIYATGTNAIEAFNVTVTACRLVSGSVNTVVDNGTRTYTGRQFGSNNGFYYMKQYDNNSYTERSGLYYYFINWGKNGSSSDYDWTYGVSGTLVTGWRQIDSRWYYFKKSSDSPVIQTNSSRYTEGEMVTGWVKISGTWYYLWRPADKPILASGDTHVYKEGEMVTGWVYLNKYWYYLSSSGAMYANGTYSIGGKNYTFDSNGHCTNP